MSVRLRYADSDYPFGIFKLFLPFASTRVHPQIFGEVRIFLSLFCVFCAKCCQCFWIVHFELLRFSLTFIYPQKMTLWWKVMVTVKQLHHSQQYELTKGKLHNLPFTASLPIVVESVQLTLLVSVFCVVFSPLLSSFGVVCAQCCMRLSILQYLLLPCSI